MRDRVRALGRAGPGIGRPDPAGRSAARGAGSPAARTSPGSGLSIWRARTGRILCSAILALGAACAGDTPEAPTELGTGATGESAAPSKSGPSKKGTDEAPSVSAPQTPAPAQVEPPADDPVDPTQLPAIEFLLDHLDGARIESHLLEFRRPESVVLPLQDLQRRSLSGASTTVVADLPFTATSDSFVELRKDGVTMQSEEGESWFLVQAERDLAASSLPCFEGFDVSRDAVGFRRVVVQRPVEVTFPVQSYGAAVDLTLTLQSGPGGVNDPLPAGHTERPRLNAHLDGVELGVFELTADGPQALRFSVPASDAVHQVSLRVEHVAPESGATTVMLRTLKVRAQDGVDRLVVNSQRDLTAAMVAYEPRMPEPMTTLERIEGGFGAEVLLAPGLVEVFTRPVELVDLLVDGEPLERTTDLAAQFRVEELKRVEIQALERGELELEACWLVQPSALLTTPLDGVRTGQEREDSHPLIRHVEVGDESRRALLVPPVTVLDVPVRLVPGDRLEWSLSMRLMREKDWPRGHSKLKVRLLDAKGERLRDLHVQGMFKELDWEWHSVDLGIEAPGHYRIQFEVLATRDAGLVACQHIVAVGEPKVVRRVETPPPNVLVYLIDTLRSDHLGCYGYERATSPNIDALAQDSVLFERAYAPSPWTRPSVASLFTGLHYDYHGAGKTTGLPEHLATLAESLREAGYDTAAFSANAHVHAGGLNFEQGFSHFTAVEKHLGESRSSDANELVFEWLEDHSDRPFFLYVHTIDPHATYDPPPQTAGTFQTDYDGRLTPQQTHSRNLHSAGDLSARDVQYLVDLYDEEILFNDHQFGRLLQNLRERDLYDNTIIVVVSDHGEEFHEHGGFGHGNRLWEELLRVPFILKLEGQEAASTRFSDPVSLVDVLPTLLARLGLAPPLLGTQGLDLGPTWTTPGTLDLFDVLAMEEPGHRCLVRGTTKFIEWYSDDPDRRELGLFDLALDPTEQNNLALQHPDRARRWQQELSSLLQRYDAAGFRTIQGQAESLSAEVRQALQALGYIDGQGD